MDEKQFEILKLQLSTITLLEAAAINLQRLLLAEAEGLIRDISKDILHDVLDLQPGGDHQ